MTLMWNSKPTEEKKPQRQQFCKCMDHGGITIFVRARPWHETAFVQVLLPVALSYETFVCKLCVALDLDRALVKKILRIPDDVLVRTTDDVLRLRQDDKLELVLHNSFWKYHLKRKIENLKPILTTLLLTMLLAMISAVALHQKEILSQLEDIRHKLVENTCHISMKTLENAYDHQKQRQAAAVDSDDDDAALTKRLKLFETILHNRLSDLEKKLEHFVKTVDAKTANSNLPPSLHYQTVQELIDQLQQLRNLLRRKMKLKEDDCA